MHRKLLTSTLLFCSLAVIALVPAVASASPVLTESGVAVATGKNISAVNDGNIAFDTNLGPVTCTNSVLSGPLVTNSGTEIASIIEGVIFTGTAIEETCTSEWLGSIKVTTLDNLPWCIKIGGKLAADAFELRGGKCTEATRNLTFTLDGSLGTCRYTRANVTGTVTTGGAQAILTVGASQTFAKEEVSSSVCPSSGTLTGKYGLVTGGTATALTIS